MITSRRPNCLHITLMVGVCFVNGFDLAKVAIASDDASFSERSAVEFVKTYCLECHQGKNAESGLDLSSFKSSGDVAETVEIWNRIAQRTHERQMPPHTSDQPNDVERIKFVDWARDTIFQSVCDDGVTPGSPSVRRLNRTEYANTVRDLLGIHVNAGHALPQEGAGGEGFDNAAETLFVSPIYAEKFLDAAKSAVGHALADPDNRAKVLIAKPSRRTPPDKAAHQVFSAFLPRAFRRPVEEHEVAEYVALFREASAQGESYAKAIEFSLVAAMVSPKFLFLTEQSGTPGKPKPVSHFEMASRLSYFLWASMPDEELFRLAKEQRLQDEGVLVQQVQRMLHSDIDRRGLRRDAKVRAFATSFVEQWLGTRALGREFHPDPSIAERYDSELEGGMKYEPIFFFEDLLADDRSLLNLIDSDFTYVNRRLADHYGIRGSFREQPRRVDLEENRHRGGLLGMSAVLAISSLPHRTSPVLRGKWILETMLGTPPPPPPPDVPELEASVVTDQPASLRSRLEQHRSNATCASCHDSMDPLGFGLENYDVLGSWRTEAEGIPIDASGELPNGEVFRGPEELKSLLMSRKEQFIRTLTRKMLGYALARGLTPEDDCVVESITQKLAKDDFRAQTLVTEIVKSIPFRNSLKN